MSIEILKRIVWRLEEKYPADSLIPRSALRKAIMFEAGTDERTIKKQIKLLKELKWIKWQSANTLTILRDTDRY